MESPDGSRSMARVRDQDRAWDFARELRSLRDSCTRFKGEEVQALRRSNEEVERSLLRRQLDESAAWQDFLGNFNSSIDVRLESMHSETNRRLEMLDNRLLRVEEGMRFADGGFSVEVQRAMSEAFLRVERSASAAAAALAAQPRRACRFSSREGEEQLDGTELDGELRDFAEEASEEEIAEERVVLFGEEKGGETAGPGPGPGGPGRRFSLRGSSSAASAGKEEREDASSSKLEKLGLRLVVAAEAAARNAAAEVAREVADAAASKLAELRRQLLKEVERQRSSLEAAAAEMGLQAEAAVVMAKGAEDAAAVAETFSLRLEASQSELQEVKETGAEHHADLHRCLASLKLEVDDALGPKIGNLEEQLQAESQRLKAVGGQAEATQEAFRQNSEALSELSEASWAHRAECAQQRQILQELFAEKFAESLSRYDKTSSELSAVAEALHGRVEAAETSIGELRTDFGSASKLRRSESMDLGSRLAELDKSSRRLMEEAVEEAKKATGALEATWRPEVQEIRHEIQASQRKSVQALESESARLTKALQELQRQGTSHEWMVPRAHQRVEYLAMNSSDAKGIWMDSPEFRLGGQGPLFLRFYPQGVSGGDGLCAVGLYAPRHDKLAALPLRLDLRVADLRKRAVAQTEAEGVLWLAHGFGTLDLVRADKEDLSIGVEVPPFAWAALERANPFQQGSSCAAVKLQDAGKDCPKTTVRIDQISRECKVANSVPGSPNAAGPAAVLSSPSPSRPGWTVFGDQGGRDAVEQPERRRPWSAQAANALRSANLPAAFATLPAQRSRKPPTNPFLPATSADGERSTNPFIDRP
ncbi:IFI30 [Symbiodinium microadriaticum]|nr:IFI30 [Symbiodinium microadriaticum]